MSDLLDEWQAEAVLDAQGNYGRFSTHAKRVLLLVKVVRELMPLHSRVEVWGCTCHEREVHAQEPVLCPSCDATAAKERAEALLSGDENGGKPYMPSDFGGDLSGE